jgi:hypothetical protein
VFDCLVTLYTFGKTTITVRIVDAGQWILIIIGVILGIFLYWVGTHTKGNERGDDEDLDDWDQQDQLEGDEARASERTVLQSREPEV